MELGDGRYELQPLPLARGGMGDVWLGRDIRLDREIAVKFLRFPNGVPDDGLVRRFDRESRITARLEHPGVPAVYDVGVHDGRPFLVMQRIHGISVADLIAEQGPLPIGWASAVAAQVCAVLMAAHGAALVHRDLKPSNLMLEPDGSVKVLDFGLAVAPTLADFSTITNTHQSLGTPAYMAPEQVEAGTSEAATDLYALGCTLHEMLSGERVFSAPTSFSVMMKQVRETPPPLRSLRPEVPVELEQLILDLLRKRPRDRPRSADVVYQRLLPFVAGLVPLPGALHPAGTSSPARSYAGVLAKIPDKPAVTSGDTSDPDMLLFRHHLATTMMSPEWREMIRHAEQGFPDVVELLRDLAVRELPVPVPGLRRDGNSRQPALAWPDRQIAMVLPPGANAVWDTLAAVVTVAADWDTRPAGAWTAESLEQRISL
ncbi:serine/threonine-protein kinase [Actinoplanes sp. DH11]|uniref:serine/threonine-protein kinase n=1 Tax=Actinoplanes sp. DH11 TaxID=2857011 RepID=UPI001E36C36D|nr:serine/threonine-protein kinase [Actinoplanes sp. DH11]